MPIVASDYRAPDWCPGSHLQTVIPARLSKRPKVAYRREVVETPDGDIVAWDWSTPEPEDRKAPVLVHFHGLEGASDSHYAEALMDACARRGWRGVVAHYRTCGGLMNRKMRAYHAGDTEENRWTLERARKLFPGAPVYAVGVSLGGNQIACFLGEYGTRAAEFVDAAVSVCAPIDLVASSERIRKGVNVFYGRMFLDTLKEKLIRKVRQFPGVISLEAAEQCKTMYDFDDLFTSRMHGFRSAMDYWQKCSAKPVLGSVRVPLLLLNAQNDPFLPAWSLPKASEISGWVTADFPEEGGHVGFPAGRFPGNLSYLPGRIMRFFDTGG